MSAEDTAFAAQNSELRRSGERRQLTIMFCDMLGSTEISTELDPEDLGEVLQAYRSNVGKAISIYGGTIAQYFGDGILVYFGYPQAHENDAECAIRAGLEIVRQLASLAHSDYQFNVRIGIATGLVVTGEALETAPKGELLAIGETPNLAARLQAVAPANGILVADSTRRLVGGLFDFGPPISVRVKGFAEPVNAHEVINISVIESRFEALRGEATPFIGREDEIALLRRRWEQACQGEGRVVLLSGEPGIGKSRTLDRIRKEFAELSGSYLRFFCSPLYTQTALYPFLSQIKKGAGLNDVDTDAARLSALADFFEATLPDPWSAAEDVAEVFGIIPPSPRHSSLSPLQRKEAALKVIRNYPLALSRQHPLLIILEDAHWIDPTSIELLDRLVEAILDYRILLIVSARPEYQPVWITHPSATLVSLSRFGSRNGAEIISGVVGGKTLPPEVTEQILERSDGVPLFLEELTKTLLVSGWLEESADRYRLRGPLPKVALPDTLQDSLTSRLDRLGPVKALAQIGSVIGREFSHRLLQSVTGLSDADIDDALSKLLDSGLIYQRGVARDAVYFFKHALIQDAAYSTLLRSKRQQVHVTIVDTILDKFPGIAATEPEIIAHHLTAAEDYARAVDYWLIAGQAQIRALAGREAVDHLKRGIGLLDRIADLAHRRDADLKLQTALIGALVAVKGAFAPEVAECCERGLRLAMTGGISPMAFPFLYGQFIYSISTGKIRQAADIAREFIRLAEAANYSSGSVMGQRLLGLALFGLAEFQGARNALEAALAAYVPERDDNVTFLFGQNVKVNSQAVLSLVLVCLGDQVEARRISDECLQTAEQLKQPHSTAISIAYSGLWVNFLLGDIEEMHAQANRLIAISTEFGLPLYTIMGHFWVGLALHREGQVDAGIGCMERALAAIEQANYKLAVPGYLAFLAVAKCDAGRIEEARATCARAKVLMEQCEEVWLAPEILCVEAEIALRSNPPNAELARSIFDQAVKHAQKFGATGIEERCTRVRARLFAEHAEHTA